MTRTMMAAAVIAVFAFTPVASQEAKPSWTYEDGKLVYGWPNSDIVEFVMICQGRTAHVIVTARPPNGKSGDKAPISFKAGASEVRHIATLDALDGIGGDAVEFAVPISDKLFDLLMRDGPIVAQVPGASRTLPPQSRLR